MHWKEQKVCNGYIIHPSYFCDLSALCVADPFWLLLALYQSRYLFIDLPFGLIIYLSIYLSIYLPIYLFIYVSFYLSISLSNYVFVYKPGYLYIFHHYCAIWNFCYQPWKFISLVILISFLWRKVFW